MKTSPTQRSLAFLRKSGFTACIVEKFLPARGGMKFPRRIDAFGFGDLLACRGNTGHVSFRDGPNSLPSQIVLVQTTTAVHMADHRAKILAIPEFYKWKEAGGLVLLHGWSKKGPRGKRKLWQVREEFL